MQSQRYDPVDALRGVAIVWMTVFHFCYDLNHFGHIRQNFLVDPFWTVQRACIVTLFMFCAGLGQAIAVQQGQTWKRFWRRWVQVAGCAVLVTIGSSIMFPRSFIYFGVLHGFAVMLVIARVSAGWGGWLWPLGLLAIALKFIAPEVLGTGTTADLFNTKPLNWLGFITRKPITEDYAPVLPWLGVMWWGVASGTWLVKKRPELIRWQLPQATQWLALLGRWSLSWYMLHQPVLIGVLMLVAALQ